MNRSTSDAARAVEEARARLRASLDALTDHVSPAGALDMARSLIDDRESRAAAADFVKRNPLPTALAATGIAWLGYALLSGDSSQKLADPRRDPGLTEVPGRSVTPPSTAQRPADAPALSVAPPAARPATEAVAPTKTGLRATFARHPLLYGVVGLVAGAVAGVIAMVKGRGEAPELPAHEEGSAVDPPATYAAGDPAAARPGNGLLHRPRNVGPAHPTAH